MHGVFFVRDSFNGATQSYEREEDNASKWSFWMYVKQISHANFVKEVQRWVLLRFWKRLFYSRKFVQETGSRSLKFNHKKFNQLWHCKPKFHLKKTSKLSRFNLCSYSCQISKEHKSRTKIEVNDGRPISNWNFNTNQLKNHKISSKPPKIISPTWPQEILNVLSAKQNQTFYLCIFR